MKRPDNRKLALTAFSNALLELASTIVHLERTECPRWVITDLWAEVEKLRPLRMAAENLAVNKVQP